MNIFSTMLEAEIFSKSLWIETEVNECRWGDRTLDRTWLACPVSSTLQQRRATGVCHRRIRSLAGPALRPEGQQKAWS
jgi:hypothetical protein